MTADPTTEALDERLAHFVRWAHYDLPLDGQWPMTREFARYIAARLEAAEARIAKTRPLRKTEWDVIYREHDVLHEARRLSRSIGVINTTAELDRALKRYDEARDADNAAALASSSAHHTTRKDA